MDKLKAGDRAVVIKDYNTGGGESFHKEAAHWQKNPVVIEEVGEDGYYVRSQRYPNRNWIFRFKDLVRAKPLEMENK